MVPKDWSEGQVKDFLFLQRGFDLTAKQAVEGTIPVYTSSGFAYYHNESKVQGPGIVTGRKGSVGPVYLINEDFWPHDTTLWVKDFKGNDIKYIEYFLKFLRLERFDEASSVPTLNRNNVHGVKCVFPPLLEQKKIAQILSTWDKAITTTEQLLANSRQQKKALMQQLLTGKKRLLDENGVRFSGEWENYKFDSLFEERVETDRNDLPLLSITVDKGVIYQEDTGRKNTSNDDKSKYRRICINDIGYNTMRMWQGRSSLSDKEGIVSPAYTIVTPMDKVRPAFVAYLFKLPALVHVFYRHSQGLVSDTWNLKFNHFKKISWQIPNIEEQQRIAAVFSTADKEIITLQQKLDVLKQEKKALMQQLLAGKRRVLV